MQQTNSGTPQPASDTPLERLDVALLEHTHRLTELIDDPPANWHGELSRIMESHYRTLMRVALAARNETLGNRTD